jgi:hypothetical protein
MDFSKMSNEDLWKLQGEVEKKYDEAHKIFIAESERLRKIWKATSDVHSEICKELIRRKMASV